MIIFINVKYLNIYSKLGWFSGKTIKVRNALRNNYLLLIKGECYIRENCIVLFVDAIVWSDINIGLRIQVEL
ncbi:hypothetical protein D9M71_785670 [compost metagenome]